MAVVFSVSCTIELKNLMKDKNISPSEALRRGVRAMLDESMPFDPTIKLDESPSNRIQQVQRNMQVCIDDLNDEVEALKNEKSI